MVNYLKGFIEQYPHIKITIENQSSAHTPVSYTHLDVYKRQGYYKNVKNPFIFL